MTGKHWLDPETFRVMFDVVNDSKATETEPNKALQSISGPWSLFRRVRLTAGSQLVEDIDQYNSLHEMFDILTSPDIGVNQMAEGFGDTWNTQENYDTNKEWNDGDQNKEIQYYLNLCVDY